MVEGKRVVFILIDGRDIILRVFYRAVQTIWRREKLSCVYLLVWKKSLWKEESYSFSWLVKKKMVFSVDEWKFWTEFFFFFFSKLSLNAGVIIDDLCLWMLSLKVITCDFTSSLSLGRGGDTMVYTRWYLCQLLGRKYRLGLATGERKVFDTDKLLIQRKRGDCRLVNLFKEEVIYANLSSMFTWKHSCSHFIHLFFF